MSRSSTSSSEPFGLLARFGAFALPLLIGGSLLEAYLWATGETRPVHRVVADQQENHERTFMRRYIGQAFWPYKIATTLERRPRILVVGSSRVMQFRARMFSPFEQDFYNAGGTVDGIADLVELTEVLLEANALPDTLIVGVDPWWLSQRPGQASARTGRYGDPAWRFDAHVTTYRRLTRDLLTGAANLHLSWTTGPSSPIGLLAWQGDGFRADGSLTYGTSLAEFGRTQSYRDRERPPVVERARNRSHQFTRLEIVDRNVDDLVAALNRLRQLGVTPAVVLPAFSDEVTEVLARLPEGRSWLADFRQGFVARLHSEGLLTVSTANPKAVGLADTAMFDGFHPGEVMAVRTVRRLGLASEPGSLLSRIDLDRLSELEAGDLFPLGIR